MKRAVLPAIAAMLLAAMTPGPGVARTLDDCEKIKDWHAYNLCLSSFGPKRGQRSVTGQPQAEGPEGRVYGRKAAARRAPGGLNVQRIAGGRVRATFDVGAPARQKRR